MSSQESELSKKLELSKKIIELRKEINYPKDDPTISNIEQSSIEHLSDANWDLLQSMRCGVHTKQEFTSTGKPIYLRLLSAREELEIENTLKSRGMFSKTDLVYEMEKHILTLSKASTRHPVLNQGEHPFLSIEDFYNMSPLLIWELGKHYADFLDKCSLNELDKMSDNEVEEVTELLIKKQIKWSNLPFLHREQTMGYLIELCQTLKEQLDNLIMPS